MSTRARFTLRQYLLAFSAALIGPGLVFAAALMWNHARAEQGRYEQEARDASHRAIAAIDRELSDLRVAAQILASSTSLQEEDYVTFHERVVTALQLWSSEKGDNAAIVVRDRAGQQVVNTRLPLGAPLPKGANPQVDQEVIATKRPVIQDLFTGATANHPIISVRVPVLKDGEVTHILSMAQEPKRLSDILRSQNLPEAWVGTLLDRSGRVVARSRDYQTFLGKLAPEEFRATQVAPEGTWRGHNLEGLPVWGAYASSPDSGWRVFVGVPADVVTAPLRRSLWLMAGLSLLLLSLSFLLALRFARSISYPVQRLAKAAKRLGRGEPLPQFQGGPVEIEEVSRALAKAARELQAREADIRQSEARLRATHENAAVGIVEVDQEGRFISVNEARCRLTGHTREELIGQPFAEPMVNGEVDRDYVLFEQQVAGILNSYTLENTFSRKDGSQGWVRVSSTAVRNAEGDFLYAVRVVEDITERKKAEERQKLLIDELNHRVKNTLATVQSLAWQSAHKGVPPEIAQQRFQERLLSLSRTHNLLNETKWEGASLRSVIQTELEPHALGGAHFRLSGPDVDLPPKTAVVLGMVVHELTTNAMKYGALSTPEGQVEVAWSLREANTLHLTWVERDGPLVKAPEGKGFGSRLIERAVARELDGTVEVRFQPEGLQYLLTVPLGDRLEQVA